MITGLLASLTLVFGCAMPVGGAEAEESCTHEAPAETFCSSELDTTTFDVEFNFSVEKLTTFSDNKLESYTLAELDKLIADNKQTMYDAHELAEAARALGWPEGSKPIKYAQAEYHNAELANKTYKARRAELEKIEAEKAEAAKWEKKAQEYPVATQVWRFMKDQGWNDYVCAGIMGNLMAEVGGQTLNLQWWLYGGNYYGICQWSGYYCPYIQGADLETQCEYLKNTIKTELDNYGFCYSSGFNYNSFLALTDCQAAAKAFAQCYERCASYTYSVRQSNAVTAYNYFCN